MIVQDDWAIPACGPENMARDLALMDRAESTARIYRWDGPWVSLGRSQTPTNVLAEGCAVPHVVRPTGGAAVLHGHDVTLAIAFKSISRSVRADYLDATAPIIAALRHCGISASLGSGAKNPFCATDDCFALASPCDIVDDNGTKICGCALRRARGYVLLQASIPISEPLVPPTSAIRGAVEHSFLSLSPHHFIDAILRDMHRFTLGIAR